jgi:hypothetical protein
MVAAAAPIAAITAPPPFPGPPTGLVSGVTSADEPEGEEMGETERMRFAMPGEDLAAREDRAAPRDDDGPPPPPTPPSEERPVDAAAALCIMASAVAIGTPGMKGTPSRDPTPGGRPCPPAPSPPPVRPPLAVPGP